MGTHLYTINSLIAFYWGSVIFYREGGGGFWKFFKFCEFLVIFSNFYCMSEIFLIPPDVLQNLSDASHNLTIKMSKLVSVFEAEIDHPLGLLKVKAGNLRGTLFE